MNTLSQAIFGRVGDPSERACAAVGFDAHIMRGASQLDRALYRLLVESQLSGK